MFEVVTLCLGSVNPTLSSASLVISKADSGSWGPVGRPEGDREPEPSVNEKLLRNGTSFLK